MNEMKRRGRQAAPYSSDAGVWLALPWTITFKVLATKSVLAPTSEVGYIVPVGERPKGLLAV